MDLKTSGSSVHPTKKLTKSCLHRVLDYPQPWSITVFNKDVQRLEREGWLNDTIVDLGLRYVQLLGHCAWLAD